MSYSVELSANFKKEAKKLIKKYPSLKMELAKLFLELEENPTIGILREIIFIKSDWLLPQKIKESQVVHEFYLL
ncbi:MAG: hypothetical protein ACEQSR_09080 [Candidatus Methylacidiphilales bacterium]